MKALVQDVLSIFSHPTVKPVFIRSGLSFREKIPFSLWELHR